MEHERRHPQHRKALDPIFEDDRAMAMADDLVEVALEAALVRGTEIGRERLARVIKLVARARGREDLRTALLRLAGVAMAWAAKLRESGGRVDLSIDRPDSPLAPRNESLPLREALLASAGYDDEDRRRINGERALPVDPGQLAAAGFEDPAERAIMLGHVDAGDDAELALKVTGGLRR